jgi:hypothetical protein
MNANDRYGSSLLTADDVDAGGIDVVIHSVQDSDKLGRLVLTFKGWDRELALNQTNAKAMIEAFGEETDYWINATVRLYRTSVMFKGSMVGSIALMPVYDAWGQPASAAQQPNLFPPQQRAPAAPAAPQQPPQQPRPPQQPPQQPRPPQQPPQQPRPPQQPPQQPRPSSRKRAQGNGSIPGPAAPVAAPFEQPQRPGPASGDDGSGYAEQGNNEIPF